MKDKFLYNKKRKHYSYIFKIRNGYCLNILLTTEAESKQKKHKKEKMLETLDYIRTQTKIVSLKCLSIITHHITITKAHLMRKF